MGIYKEMQDDYNEVKEETMVRRRRKKHVYIIVIVVLLAVAGGVGFAVWNSYVRNNGEQQQEESEIKDDYEVKVEKDGKGGDEEKVVEKNDDVEPEREKEKEEIMTYEGNNPNSEDGLTGAVTFAGTNGDTLVIRINIDQYITSGSCELGLYKNGAIVYSDTANISAAASTATCEGFNVPIGSIGEGGQYQIVINVRSGDKVGVINGEVEI